MVDASALTKYVLREEGWEQVGLLLKKRRPVHTLDHILKEVGNAIWRHAALRRIIDKDLATTLYSRLLGLVEAGVIVVEPESRYLEEAFRIAMEHSITVYDSLYLAQARRLGELLTSDEEQARVAQKLGIRTHLIP